MDKEYRCYSFRESLRLSINRTIGLQTISRRMNCRKILRTLNELGRDWANDYCLGGANKATILVSSGYYAGNRELNSCRSTKKSEEAGLSVLCEDGHRRPLRERRRCSEIKIASFKTPNSTSDYVSQGFTFGGLRIASSSGFRDLTFPDSYTVSTGCSDGINLSPGAGNNVLLPPGCSVTLGYPSCLCNSDSCIRNNRPSEAVEANDTSESEEVNTIQ